MRVAGLFDIHGNLPALEAVREEVRREGVDRGVEGEMLDAFGKGGIEMRDRGRQAWGETQPRLDTS